MAPRTPLEEILASIWASVLRLERIGRRDQFFKLGGHSLQATQIVARLRELLHIELPVRTIYDAPTIPALAAAIEKIKQGARGQHMPPLQRVERTGTGTFPLSFAQQRLWFLDQLQPGSAYYNIPGAYSIKGSLDVAALEQSLNALVQRHEALRTTFALADEQPVQVIAPVLHVPLPVVELSAIGDASVQETEVARLVRAEARRAFDLQRGPLLRATVLRLQPGAHVLLLTLHHIVADGWSADIFFRELHLAYTAYVTGQPLVLPELPIQYADYAVWQREWLQGPIVEEQVAYWRTQLSGMPPALNLPTDHPRPAVQTFTGAMASFALSPSLTARLKALSQQEGVTLFMTLLASFQVLLARYSGQDDIAVGTPIAGRTRVQTEHLIGFFVNTLVLRTDLSGNPTLKELLARVREVSLEAYMHQDLPFERLVEEVHPQRSLSHSPLFQVLFMLQAVTSMATVAPDRSEQPGLSLEPLGIGSGTAKFDLSFDLLETPAGIEGVMEYNTDLFEATTIKRMLSHYIAILESIAADAEQPIALLPLLPTSERQQMLIAWNDTRRHHPQQGCLHHLFEAQAAQAPDTVAIVFEEQHVTYRELNERANKLAHYLQGLGVGPDAVVGLCLERSHAIVVGVLAILKAGGTYTPLDPHYPTQRLAFLLADTRMTVLLTQQRLLEHLPASTAPTVRVLCLDSEWQEVTAQPNTCPRNTVGPEHLAYVIYTSGSTGAPKGVAMPHASLVNLFRWQQRHSALPEGARTLQFASLSFDVASQEIFCTLGFGHTLVLLTEELRRDPGGMLRLLIEEAVERLFLPGVALQQLAEAASEAASVPTVLSEVITAGEQLQITAHVVNLFERLPNCRLVNQYGPSESHVVSAYTLSSAPSRWPALPPIGRPIDNTDLYVLDTYLQPVPVGVQGELYIGGRGVARGYFARPDLTAERFVPHPFSPLAGTRLYKTGDQVCYLPDSTIQFLGRRDQQVKIRGFRVELGEIEAVLTRHSAVHEAVVVARENRKDQDATAGASGDKYLVAYVVIPQETSPSLHTQLRHYLQTQLPDYMIPSRFIVLDTLPLTSHGKIDYRALLADIVDGEEDVSSSIPRTPLEEVLAAIWSELLHRERVGTQDNFFDLGGHSLLATRMVARVREALKVVIPLRMVFETPTIAGLATWIEQANRDTFAAIDTVPLEPRPTEETLLPLSYAQERLWFLNQLDPASPAYTLTIALHIQGDLDIHALEESLNVLVQRHEALRTTFIVTDGIPRQMIAPSVSINLPLIDLSDYSQPVRSREVEHWSTEVSLQPFDLSQGPLLRVTLLRLSEQKHRLLLTIHHSITDAWSMGILTNELSAVYTALAGRVPYSLPVLPVQYADYALWQRRWLQGEVLEQQVAYWRKQLLDAPTVLNLPTDRPRPALQSYRGDACFFPLPHSLSQELQALSRRNATTLFMTSLAALQVLLFRYSGQTDMVIGTPIAGRSRSEVEGLIGLFVNTLALRTDLSGDLSFRTLLARVREVCLEAYAHQDVPFEKVVEAVQPERSLSHHPLFQVMFMLQNAPAGDVTLPGLDLRPLPLGSPTTKFDLTVEFTETPTGLHGVVEYNTDLFERATIERLIQHYQQLLEEIVQNPDQRISLLPLPGKEEQHRLLVEWNATSNDAIPSACVHQLFEEQALRSPDAIALTCDDQQLTFAELNRRANQLAHGLQARGVRPEVCVGMYMTRSLEMVVGVLGILKAGGAYVPLDPAFPMERLAFMLQETQAPLVLTQHHLRDRLPAHTARVICLDSDWLSLAQAASSSPICTATGNNLAYIIYTSGSTGRPKGVQVEHCGLTNYICWCLKAYAVEQGQGSLLHSSLASDLTVTSLFAPLLAGQRLMLLPEEQGLDALGEALCQSHDLSLLKLTPAHLLLLAEQLATRDVAGRTRALIIGGEALLQEHLAFWREHASETHLINEYGPTETVVGCCMYELVRDEKGHVRAQGERKVNEGSVPIGRPIANTQLYLLDQHFQTVPIGVPGELYIGGRGVARGYRQRPELTAERFLPNPFSQEPGTRLYRTGDIARYLPNGNIEFLGRNDTQVKLRGYRIEPGEIEAVLRGHSEVQEAVVLLEAKGSAEEQGHSSMEQHLVAYLLGRPSSTLSASQLRSYLREYLPDYMVPTSYVILEALPLSSNGKVDRRALRLVHGQTGEGQLLTPAGAQAGRDPRSPLEETLVGIWMQVLGQVKVSIDDNFFDLGGHSLLVTQVVSRVREQLQVELPLRTLFETPIIADFAEAIIQQELAQANNDELLHLLTELEDLATDEV
ncbi:MAG: amino acid adenylation domain-containing protein [Ktedonobacteraceae bacterium]|nr:amino acid adenylation domain-containing protein [Ktedonobacteraceae bacterium]